MLDIVICVVVPVCAVFLASMYPSPPNNPSLVPSVSKSLTSYTPPSLTTTELTLAPNPSPVGVIVVPPGV